VDCLTCSKDGSRRYVTDDGEAALRCSVAAALDIPSADGTVRQELVYHEPQLGRQVEEPEGP